MKLAACLLSGTLLFSCAHPPKQIPAANPAPGNPAVLILAPSCPVAKGLQQALVEGGVAAQTLDVQDASDALLKLDVLVERMQNQTPHRFMVGLGDTRSLVALLAARQRPLTGVALISPPPLHLDGTNPAGAPMLIFTVAATVPPITSAVTPPIWEVTMPTLGESWRELPPAQLHTLTEAILMWIRARSVD
jgi:hypothetical protein